MKRALILGLKLAGVAVVWYCWLFTANRDFSFFWSITLVWGGIALVPVVVAAGRWLLDRHATIERTAALSPLVHYLVMMLLGCAIIVAFRFTQAYPIARVAFPKKISLPVVQITGALAVLTVLNLAMGGLGLPFAAVQSRKIATRWLYARCRNPMGLYSLLCCIAGAVWLQSLHAILWTTLWLAPAWILFVRLYEERELEIRFGEPYLQYKARTPFFGF
jgi:protein-S-isoprenylcysteine O-methyltransferase Ste14